MTKKEVKVQKALGAIRKYEVCYFDYKGPGERISIVSEIIITTNIERIRSYLKGKDTVLSILRIEDQGSFSDLEPCKKYIELY